MMMTIMSAVVEVAVAMMMMVAVTMMLGHF